MSHNRMPSDNDPAAGTLASVPIYCPPDLDADKYRHFVEDFEMTKEQQEELLGIIWNIMRSFVELGWGVDSVNRIFAELAQNALREEFDSARTETKKIASRPSAGRKEEA